MEKNRRHVLGLGLGLLGLMGLFGTAQAQIVVAPPGARVERRPPPPPGPPGAWIWQGGYWSWTGNAYVWVSGRWVHRPHEHAEWVEGHWGRGGSHASGEFVTRPKQLTVSRVEPDVMS